MMPAQGTYLAPLTQLSRLCTMFERLPTAAQRLSADRLVVRLHEYPLSLYAIDFELADSVRLTVESYFDATSDIRTAFWAREGSRKTSLVLTDASWRLSGAHVEGCVHSLEVQTEEASHSTDLDCPASCLLDWVAQSRAQSFALLSVRGTPVGSMRLKTSVAGQAEELPVTESHARLSHIAAEFSRLCARSGLTCVCGGRAVVLRSIADTSL